MNDQPKKKKAPARLSEIAAKTGLAVSTISRALSNPGRVNYKTRELVVKAAEELNYTANVAARILKGGASRMILVLQSLDYESVAVEDALRGIDLGLKLHGYGMIVGHLDRITMVEQHLLALMDGGLVDGILTISGHLPSSIIKRLSAAGIPIVTLLFDQTGSGIPSVVTNDREAMRESARHLISLGHRTFWYANDTDDSYNAAERRRGVEDALEQAGIPPGQLIVAAAGHSLHDGVAAGRAFLAAPQRATAVLCFSDALAIGFLRALREASVRVPQDVAVLGFDGTAFSEFCEPPLTTVKQPLLELGRAGVNLLIDIVNRRGDNAVSKLVLDSQLVIRGSTQSAAP